MTNTEPVTNTTALLDKAALPSVAFRFAAASFPVVDDSETAPNTVLTAPVIKALALDNRLAVPRVCPNEALAGTVAVAETNVGANATDSDALTMTADWEDSDAMSKDTETLPTTAVVAAPVIPSASSVFDRLAEIIVAAVPDSATAPNVALRFAVLADPAVDESVAAPRSCATEADTSTDAALTSVMLPSVTVRVATLADPATDDSVTASRVAVKFAVSSAEDCDDSATLLSVTPTAPDTATDAAPLNATVPSGLVSVAPTATDAAPFNVTAPS